MHVYIMCDEFIVSIFSSKYMYYFNFNFCVIVKPQHD